MSYDAWKTTDRVVEECDDSARCNRCEDLVAIDSLVDGECSGCRDIARILAQNEARRAREVAA